MVEHLSYMEDVGSSIPPVRTKIRLRRLAAPDVSLFKYAPDVSILVLCGCVGMVDMAGLNSAGASRASSNLASRTKTFRGSAG